VGGGGEGIKQHVVEQRARERARVVFNRLRACRDVAVNGRRRLSNDSLRSKSAIPMSKTDTRTQSLGPGLRGYHHVIDRACPEHPPLQENQATPLRAVVDTQRLAPNPIQRRRAPPSSPCRLPAKRTAWCLLRRRHAGRRKGPSGHRLGARDCGSCGLNYGSALEPACLCNTWHCSAFAVAVIYIAAALTHTLTHTHT
jgi:hypothetical protein